jgi:peptidoglycan/xylan/chitin deacetylase (PgdA/CDA1 family)
LKKASFNSSKKRVLACSASICLAGLIQACNPESAGFQIESRAPSARPSAVATIIPLTASALPVDSTATLPIASNQPLTQCTLKKESTPQAVGDQVKADLWPWGAKAAISLTIDEGLKEPYDILMPEIELRGWRASFYIYTLQPTLEKSWDRVVLAHQRGHEVSNHTHTHPNLTKLSDAEIHKELIEGNAELRKHLGPDLKLESFAYPYEATDERTSAITLKYHRYNRAGDQGAATPPYPINDARKPNFGALKAKAPTSKVSLQSWNSWVDATVREGGWFIEELHGVEDVGVKGGWEPRTIQEFQAHFDHIESFGPQIWVAPMVNVGNYIEEREALQIKQTQWGADGVQLILDDAFNDSIFDEPLTLLVTLPKGWKGSGVKAIQAGKTLTVRSAEQGQVRIQALPDPAKPVCLLPD